MKTNIGEVNNLAFRKEKSDYNFGQWIAGFAIVFVIIAGWSLITLIFN
jgi:hypothetical protein